MRISTLEITSKDVYFFLRNLNIRIYFLSNAEIFILLINEYTEHVMFQLLIVEIIVLQVKSFLNFRTSNDSKIAK